jgi:hypothetical protein
MAPGRMICCTPLDRLAERMIITTRTNSVVGAEAGASRVAAERGVPVLLFGAEDAI